MDKYDIQSAVQESAAACHAYCERASPRGLSSAALGCIAVCALGLAGLNFFNNKKVEIHYTAQITEIRAEPRINEEPHTEYAHGIWASKNAHKILQAAWSELHSLNARRDLRAWGELCDMLGDDGLISSDEAQEVADDVLDPRKPVGKLWLPYRGPRNPPAPDLGQQAKLAQMYAEYRKWRPVIERLVDDDGDGVPTEQELFMAAYKVLRQ